MRIETPHHSVTVEDLPEPERIVQILVNLSDQTIELTYKGYVSPYHLAPALSDDAASWADPAS